MGKVEAFFGSPFRIDVLRLLIAKEAAGAATAPATAREIARQTFEATQRASLRSYQRAVRELIDAGAIRVDQRLERRGREAPGAEFCRLDRDHPFVRHAVLPLFQLDRPAKDDPIAAIRLSLTDLPPDAAVESAVLEEHQPGDFYRIYFIPSHRSEGAKEVERALRRATMAVAVELAVPFEFVPLSYSNATEYAAKPEFRERVLERGTPLLGPALDAVISRLRGI